MEVTAWWHRPRSRTEPCCLSGLHHWWAPTVRAEGQEALPHPGGKHGTVWWQRGDGCGGRGLSAPPRFCFWRKPLSYGLPTRPRVLLPDWAVAGEPPPTHQGCHSPLPQACQRQAPLPAPTLALRARGPGQPGPSARRALSGRSAASGWSQRAALARAAAARALRSPTAGGNIASERKISPLLHPPPSLAPPPAFLLWGYCEEAAERYLPPPLQLSGLEGSPPARQRPAPSPCLELPQGGGKAGRERGGGNGGGGLRADERCSGEMLHAQLPAGGG